MRNLTYICHCTLHDNGLYNPLPQFALDLVVYYFLISPHLFAWWFITAVKKFVSEVQSRESNGLMLFLKTVEQA